MSDTINQVSRITALREITSSVETASLQPEAGTAASEVTELELEDGTTYAVTKSDPKASVWQEFLESQRVNGLPVFVQADRESRLVREVLPVFERRVDVVDPRPIDGRLRVLFLASPAIFFLNPALPGFVEWRSRLVRAARDKAPVLVTHHPLTLEVIDVRDAPTESAGSTQPTSEATATETPFVPVSAITLTQAFQVFDALAHADIPFFHLPDCCTARAQRMCNLLLQNHKIVARKLWNYGRGFATNKQTLCVKTPLFPSGQICWVFHVAPIVEILDDPVGRLVFDPSLFDKPVPVNTWLLEQNDCKSFQEITDAGNYGNKPNSTLDVPDPGPAKVDADLKGHTGESILLKSFHALLLEPPI